MKRRSLAIAVTAALLGSLAVSFHDRWYGQAAGAAAAALGVYATGSRRQRRCAQPAKPPSPTPAHPEEREACSARKP